MTPEPVLECANLWTEPELCCAPLRIAPEVDYCQQPAPYAVVYAFPSGRRVEHSRCVEHAAADRLPPRNRDGSLADYVVEQLRTRSVSP